VSPGWLGFLVGVAVVVFAFATGWVQILWPWFLLVLIGWAVFAIRDRRRHSD